MLIIYRFDSYKEYEAQNHSYFFGCVVGRVANRIKYGKFNLNGKEYSVPLTEEFHTCHSGKKVFFFLIVSRLLHVLFLIH